MADKVVMSLRLPAELHADLRRLADEDERSLASLIVRILRRAAAAGGAAR